MLYFPAKGKIPEFTFCPSSFSVYSTERRTVVTWEEPVAIHGELTTNYESGEEEISLMPRLMVLEIRE